MGRAICSVVVLLCAVVFVPASAFAHLDLLSPPSRYGGDVLKTGPCGRANGERSNRVSVFEPGETITLRWEEYVQHPGHFRVAFDDDGDDDFIDPPKMMDFYSNDAVLLDDIADSDSNSIYEVQVTLPNIECDNCTLQVIQVMYDKPPYVVPGNDIYYQCADLVLKIGGGPLDGGVGASDSGPAANDSSGCNVAAVDGTAFGWGSVLGACVLCAWRCRLNL